MKIINLALLILLAVSLGGSAQGTVIYYSSGYYPYGSQIGVGYYAYPYYPYYYAYYPYYYYPYYHSYFHYGYAYGYDYGGIYCSAGCSWVGGYCYC